MPRATGLSCWRLVELCWSSELATGSSLTYWFDDEVPPGSSRGRWFVRGIDSAGERSVGVIYESLYGILSQASSACTPRSPLLAALKFPVCCG